MAFQVKREIRSPWRGDEWLPELDGLTLGWGLPEDGVPLDGKQRIDSLPIPYPHKAVEAHIRAWKALYSLRRARKQVMTFNFTIGAGFAPITALHREIFLHPAGRAQAVYVFAAVPPQGQPMILDIQRRGESILEPQSLAIPEGFAEVVKLDSFVFNPLPAEESDVFSGHILQLGSTTKGEGVTMAVVWEVQD